MYVDTGNVVLNDEQNAAAAGIANDLMRGFAVHVLDGITGSGKTQVYFDAALRTYAAGKSVLLMMPEIALTAQFKQRFTDRFGAAPVVWHSNLTAARRRDIWRGVASGEIRIVVGTRSALFLPWQDLGLIVVDEEHDSSYKQEDMGNYHARDMAILRGGIENFPVILASATPSAETVKKINDGAYKCHRLTSRFGGAIMPTIELIDMRVDRPEKFPPPLEGGVAPLARRGEAHHHSQRYTDTAFNFSRELKRTMTEAERLMWHYLKSGKLDNFDFRKQQPVGKYIVDFICLTKKLIVELDGCHHGEGVQIKHDAIRDKFLQDSGYRIIRFWNEEVFKKMEMILDTIHHYLTHDEIPPLQWFYPKEIIDEASPSRLSPTAPSKGGGNSGHLSPTLCAAMDATLVAGQQAMLFINRRGYAPIVQCKNCGWAATCPDCSVGMTLHKRNKEQGTGKLICRICGRTTPMPTECPECKNKEFSFAGTGVEKIQEEVRARWPAARTALVSSDTMQSRQALERLVTQMESGEIDIVIGTQILAKGHHFPNLTLVGVIDADMGLFGTDFRSGERTFQQLFQVAGRAGRGHVPGRVLIQTYQPEHPVLRSVARGDRDALMAMDLDGRRAAGMPPYGQLIALIIEGEKESALLDFCARMAACAPKVKVEERRAQSAGINNSELKTNNSPSLCALRSSTSVKIFGPIPAQIYQIRNWFRMRFLVSGPERTKLQPVVAAHLSKIKIPANIKIKIDVNPQNFM